MQRLARLAVLALGCGTVADQSAGAPDPPRTLPVTCTHSATAPWLELTGVQSTVSEGPCGDVMFQRDDDSLWLRSAQGDVVQLAASGTPGSFDATGTLASYAAGREHVIRTLATGEEVHVQDEPRFGYDPDTQQPIAFTCGEGVRIFRGNVLGAVVAGSERLRCNRYAELGPVVALASAAQLSFLDLRTQRVVQAAVDHQNASQPGRGDATYLALGGRIALHEQVTYVACSDTFCGSSSGVDVIRTDTGAVTGHVADSSIYQSDDNRPAAGILDRGDGILHVASGGDSTWSVDVEGRLAVYPDDTDVRRLQEDGTLVLGHKDGRRYRVTRTTLGSAVETPWLELACDPVDGASPSLSVWPTGERVAFVEPTQSIGVTGETSTWGGMQYGDLVVRDGTREVLRKKYVRGASALVFAGDTAILEVLGYDSAPPADVASSSDLPFSTERLALDAAGVVTTLEASEPSLQGFGIGEGRAALVSDEYFGQTSRTTVYGFDANAHVLSLVSRIELGSQPVRTIWPQGPAALALVTTGGAGSSLWHGVP